MQQNDRRRRSLLALTVGCAAVVSLIGCDPSRPDAVERVVVERAAFPVALVPTPDGGFLYAERLTGRVRRVDGQGALDADPVGRVVVATEGQRGLLGVAVDQAGRVFAAYTSGASGRPIEVAQVAPSLRTVWSGPPSARLANGGHLAFDPERGRLILGVGNLGRRAEVADPDTANGKLLLLDPDGAPTQRPSVLSGGWNNPFAFALTPEGDLWVADNVPGERGERLARGDIDGRPTRVTILPTNTVPAGLTALSDDTLIVCGFARGRTLRYRVHNGRPDRTSGFGDDAACRTGIAAQARDGGLLLADERSIRRLAR